MTRCRNALLSAVALGALHCGATAALSADLSSQAQDEKIAEKVTVKGGINSSNGVRNTTPGGGLMPVQTIAKAVSGVTRDYIAKVSPTANALTLVKNLSGVVLNGSDPLGMNTHMNISVRGLSQTELGAVFEGFPASDPVSYVPYASEWADTENIESLNITKGSPDITDPVVNAVGGSLTMTLRQPSARMGGFLDLTYGTKSLEREFARFDTGEIGRSGVRGFVSFSDSMNHEWRGSGRENRQHVDAKFVKEWGDGNRVTPRISWTHLRSSTDTYPTMAQWHQYGISYNYAKYFTKGNASYQPFYESIRDTFTLSTPTHLNLGHGVTADTVPYFYVFNGSPNGGATISETASYLGSEPAGNLNLPYASSGKVVAQSQQPYNETMGGVNSYLSWKLGNNTARFGFAYSYLDYTQAQNYALADLNGNVANDSGKYPVLTQGGKVLRTYNGHFIQQMNLIYLDDTIKALHDRLTLNAGMKVAMVNRIATDDMPGAQYQNNVNHFEPLPEVSASYQIDRSNKVYVNAHTAFSEPGYSAFFDIFNASTGKISSSHANSLKPEYSISEEIGYRYQGYFNFQGALFNYNLTNKIISSSSIENGTSTTLSINAGGETIRGAEVEASTHAWHHFSAFASGQYLHATMDNNISYGGDYLRTKGNTAVLTPKFSGALGLSYDDGTIFGNFNLNYVDSQYSTFMNNEAIHSYVTSDMSLGYRMKNFAFFRRPQIQLNLANLANNHYLSGAYGVTASAKSTKGVYGTAIAASSPTYYVGGGFGAYVSLSTGF